MHLFRYVQDKDKDIKKYFVIKRDSNDYNEIKKIGPVLPFKSIKHRFLGMFVENIVTSHPDSEIIYPFWGTYPHLAGLLKSNNIFLQHGIIKDDVSLHINRYKKNLRFRKQYDIVNVETGEVEALPTGIMVETFDNVTIDITGRG